MRLHQRSHLRRESGRRVRVPGDSCLPQELSLELQAVQQGLCLDAAARGSFRQLREAHPAAAGCPEAEQESGAPLLDASGKELQCPWAVLDAGKSPLVLNDFAAGHSNTQFCNGADLQHQPPPGTSCLPTLWCLTILHLCGLNSMMHQNSQAREEGEVAGFAPILSGNSLREAWAKQCGAGAVPQRYKAPESTVLLQAAVLEKPSASPGAEPGHVAHQELAGGLFFPCCNSSLPILDRLSVLRGFDGQGLIT